MSTVTIGASVLWFHVALSRQVASVLILHTTPVNATERVSSWGTRSPGCDWSVGAGAGTSAPDGSKEPAPTATSSGTAFARGLTGPDTAVDRLSTGPDRELAYVTVHTVAASIQLLPVSGSGDDRKLFAVDESEDWQ